MNKGEKKGEQIGRKADWREKKGEEKKRINERQTQKRGKHDKTNE